jgi:Transcriptional regulator
MSTEPTPAEYASVALKPRSPGRPRDLSLTLKRREEILEMATQLFARKGFRNTDLRAVAEGLGVAKGTIYNYFDSKNDLFLPACSMGWTA